MSAPLDLQLGPAGGDGMRVQVLSRAHPGGLGTLRGWLLARIDARDARGPWRADVFLRADELVRFADQLEELRAGARVEARWSPRDPWVAGEVTRLGDRHAFAFRARTRTSSRVASVVWHADAEAVRVLADAVAAIVRRFAALP